MRALIELQRGEAVLAVDDEEIIFRLLQPADPAAVVPDVEAQLLRREQQDRSGNGRLRDRRLVEVADGADLGAGKFPLEGLVAPLDAGDELGDVVFLRHFLGLDRFTPFVVKPADEPHLGQQLLRPVRGEVEDGVFLADLCGDHGNIFR